MRCGWEEGVSGGFFVGFFVFGVLGVPLFDFSFFLGKGGFWGEGDSSFFKFLNQSFYFSSSSFTRPMRTHHSSPSFFVAANIRPPTPNKIPFPQTQERCEKKEEKKKNSPKHRPPRPKKQTQTPHLHTRR